LVFKFRHHEVDSRVFIDFIDILYAVVVGQSFVFLVDHKYYGAWFPDVMHNLNFFKNQFNPGLAAPHIFGMITILTLYCLLITSWINYHSSIDKYEFYRRTQFIIDILLIFLYYVAFTVVTNYVYITYILLAVFILYIVWDIRTICSKHITEAKKIAIMEDWFKTGLFLNLIVSTLIVMVINSVGLYETWLIHIVTFACILVYAILSWPEMKNIKKSKFLKMRSPVSLVNHRLKAKKKHYYIRKTKKRGQTVSPNGQH